MYIIYTIVIIAHIRDDMHIAEMCQEISMYNIYTYAHIYTYEYAYSIWIHEYTPNIYIPQAYLVTHVRVRSSEGAGQ